MCVGIPRKIVEISNPETNLAMIAVESCVGEWALINLGFAMSRIDETEAHKTLELLRELGEAQMQMDAMLRNNKD